MDEEFLRRFVAEGASWDNIMPATKRRLIADVAALLARNEQLSSKFASCGLCRQVRFVQMNSNCDVHRDSDEDAW
jgi:hypothetical protein